MNCVLRLIVLLGTLSLANWNAASGESTSIVSIPTPRGVQQPFILIKPDHAIASVILLAGGNGVLKLNRVPPPPVGANDFVSGNFLVRSREKFAGHGFMVAAIDVPSDQPKGMSPSFRVSNDHAIDIGAVAHYLKRQADVPVWLVGTSAGTWSAARAAIGASRDGIASGSIDGLVLTSTVTRIAPRSTFATVFPEIARDFPSGVISMALSEITMPTLIVSHSEDACELTPAVDAEALARRLTHAAKVEIALLNGGDPPKSVPCEAYAAHGYYGIETEAVDRIADFVTTNSKRTP
ncbi:alpha/beta hydrolase [Bradyrhizobium macuxiense]|uniref:alpha/beta hydrolase n=1 Tax=Bradyrhizobium macuxiense TaxID=1755647 RepID=UPI00082B420C|nr:alpha/beta hydrolase [Bradyrhizobium macuxiense]